MKTLLTNKNIFCTALIAFACALTGTSSQDAQAKGWGLSLAYHNPYFANIGGNLMYTWTSVAVELGLGAIDGRASDKDGNSYAKGALAGDIDVKFFFGQEWAPYVELGLGLSVGAGVGSGGGFGFSAAGPFAGGGLMWNGSKLFAYGAVDYVLNSKSITPVFGVGVKF